MHGKVNRLLEDQKVHQGKIINEELTRSMLNISENQKPLKDRLNTVRNHLHHNSSLEQKIRSPSAKTISTLKQPPPTPLRNWPLSVECEVINVVNIFYFHIILYFYSLNHRCFQRQYDNRPCQFIIQNSILNNKKRNILEFQMSMNNYKEYKSERRRRCRFTVMATRIVPKCKCLDPNLHPNFSKVP